MRTIKQVAALAAVLLIVFLPSLVFGQESAPVEIVPPAPPPVMSKAEWFELASTGAFWLFIGVELLKKNFRPLFDKLGGWGVFFVVVVPGSAIAAVLQVSYTDPLLLVKHAGFVLFLAVGGRAGFYKVIDKVKSGKAPELVNPRAPATVPPPSSPSEPPSQGPTVPPVVPHAPRAPELGGNLLRIGLVALALIVTGCTREAFLARAVPVADTLEGQVRTAGVDVNSECEVPMQKATDAGDKAAGRAIAAKCDEPVLSYKGGRTAHLLLTEAIWQVYAGGDVGSAGALIPKAIKAGMDLVAGTKALRGEK